MATLRRSLLAVSRAQPPTPIRRLGPISLLRFNSSSNRTKQYCFADIKQFISHPSPTRLIVDVREPDEYSAGAIPGAVNLPIGRTPDALMLSEEEFEQRYNMPKPSKTKMELVFYCKAGIRSHNVAERAKEAGYEKVGEYGGSWDDWVKSCAEAGK